jgi:uncharacterized repeat protein (TIGR01451 family)
MRKILLAITLFTYLFNYAVTITSTATTLGGQPAFQFEVTDPLYMPAFYYDDMLDAYPPDGWSFFWQTDEGAVSSAEKPIFHFSTSGVHTVHLLLVPRKKDNDEDLEQTSFTLNVDPTEVTTESNGVIHDDPIFMLTQPRLEDKLYVVVPLNSCDLISARHTHSVLFDNTKLVFSEILSIAGISGESVSSETNVVLGEPTNSKLVFTKMWTAYRNDVAAVVEFDVIANQGEAVVVEHRPDKSFPNQCKPATAAIEFGAIGPYDPNYKESSVNEINVSVVDSSKLDSTSVEYTIHFQNIGNGPVDSITVIDSLPNYLVFDSHVLSSLPAAKVNVSVTGNVVTWKLAPNADVRGTNESPSQAEYKTKGWVKFKAKIAPEGSITYDTCYCLCNRATIYFDSLAPITTKADIIAIGDQLCFSPVGGKPDGEYYASKMCYDSTKYYGRPTLGVREQWSASKFSNLTAYPNPTEGKVNFKGDFKGSIDVEVYSMYGQLLLATTTASYRIDLSDLPVGSYNVKITNEDNLYFARVIRY